jgi:hypothetical protein
VGSVNSEGLRGTLATKDFQEGETIAMIPNELTIEIAPFSFPGAVSLLVYEAASFAVMPEKGNMYEHFPVLGPQTLLCRSWLSLSFANS